MPGDPLRAKFIADTYLTDAKLVNNVRGVHGYTGTWQGKRVSVMASGMGMPSIGIYSYELFNFYGVENIIRIGSAGAMTDKLHLRDIVAGMSAYTNSNYGASFGFSGHLAPCCSYELLTKAVEAGKALGQPIVPGPIFSSDCFYEQGCDKTSSSILAKLGVLCVEMEAAALYLNAAAGGQERAGAADHLRQPRHRRSAAGGGPPEHVHQDDGDRFDHRLTGRARKAKTASA